MFVRSSRYAFLLAFIAASLVLRLVRGRSIGFVSGWVASGRASLRDFLGTVRGCVIRNVSSHRVMRYTCRARS